MYTFYILHREHNRSEYVQHMYFQEILYINICRSTYLKNPIKLTIWKLFIKTIYPISFIHILILIFLIINYKFNVEALALINGVTNKVSYLKTIWNVNEEIENQ